MWEVQDRRCFYCRTRIADPNQSEVDHFLPWARYPDDGLDNFVVADKKCNAPGLQIADLVARPIGRKLLDPAQPNRAYDILERKFRRSPQGKIGGWGLKVFP